MFTVLLAARVVISYVISLWNVIASAKHSWQYMFTPRIGPVAYFEKANGVWRILRNTPDLVGSDAYGVWRVAYGVF